ncbi:GNAT family N-acetyltransferase [Ornithinibacillus salinisoli]|uniref:GNAT family N-acetyltransferase n=1 Tax=Ornithinibacillus salinisoli TaxID=1848459 RepID=A0ABW4W4L2_9BACI
MHTIKKGTNKFYIGETEERSKAEITFNEQDGSVIVIDHTYVADDLRGQGVAGELVDRVVSYAREHGKKINPECSYAKSKMEKTSTYRDVLV